MNIIGVNPITSLLYIEIPKLSGGYGSHTDNTVEVRADLRSLSSWYISHPDMTYCFDVSNKKAVVECGTSRDKWQLTEEEVNNASTNSNNKVLSNGLIEAYNNHQMRYLQSIFSNIKHVDELSTVEECTEEISKLLDLINETFLVDGITKGEPVELVLEALGGQYSLYQAKKRIVTLLKSKEE